MDRDFLHRAGLDKIFILFSSTWTASLSTHPPTPVSLQYTIVNWVTAAITIAGRRDYVRLTFTPIGSAVYGQDNVGQGLGAGENRMTIASHQPGLPSEASSRLLAV